ncbi:hypothetical protein [Spirosoma aerophilum]
MTLIPEITVGVPSLSGGVGQLVEEPNAGTKKNSSQVNLEFID